MTDFDISIVIVSWNTKRLLLDCLASLMPCTRSRRVEIIVVDNASSDGSPDAVAREYPAVRLIRNESNLGFAKANNVGLSVCRGRYLCLMNSDIKVLDDCIEKLIDYMDAHPGIGMLGPKIFYSDLTPQSSCRRFPTLWNSFCGFFGLSKLFPRSPFFAGEHMFYFTYDRIAGVDVLVGCFVVARREAFEQVGLLDEQFFMYAEDVDLCRRFREKGWKLMFYPDARAIHYCGGSSSNAPVKFAIEQQRSVLMYWRKHHGLAPRTVFAFLNIVRYTLRLVGAAIQYVARPAQRKQRVSDLVATAGCLKLHFKEGVFPGQRTSV